MADDKARKNSEEFKKNMQGAEKSSKTMKDTVSDLTKQIVQLEDSLKGISARFKEIAKGSKEVDTTILVKGLAKGADITDKLVAKARMHRETIADTGKVDNSFNKDRIKFQIEYDTLLSKEAILKERLVSASEADAKVIRQALVTIGDQKESLSKVAKIYDDIGEKIEEIESNLGFLMGMEEMVENIPIVGKFFSSASKRSAELRKNLGEGAHKSKVMAANFAAIAETAGKVMVVGFFAALTKGFSAMDERTKSFTSQLNISKDASKLLNENIVKFAANIPGQTAAKLAEAIVSVSTNLGAVVNLSNESARAFSVMTNNLGLSSEEANKLLMTSVSQDKSIEDFNQNLAGSVTLVNASSGVAVRFQDVMADIASASAGTQLNTAKFPGGLEKAAYQARRFGMTLSGLENSASNLLNFEESIGAELEAELLTGRSLNLERARAAALTGNQTVLAEELKKNIGDIDQFQNQSVLAQEAQARALGMTRDEVAEILMRQKALATLANVEGDSLEAKVKTRLKEINAIKDVDEREKALAKLKEETGAKQLIQQEQNRTLQERMLEATEKIADAAGVMVAPFTAIGKLFDFIAEQSASVLGFMGKIGSKLSAIAAFGTDLATNIKFAKIYAGQLFKAFGAGFKIAAKGGIKSLLKKIPILGAAVGAYLGYQRFKSGDYLGALAEVGSGIASIFPGVGTLASMAIDTALLGADAAGITGTDPERRTNEVVNSVNRGLETVGNFAFDSLAAVGSPGVGAAAVVKAIHENTEISKKNAAMMADAANKDIYMGPEKVGTSLSVSSIKNDG